MLQENGEKLLELYKGHTAISVSAATSLSVYNLLKVQGFTIRKQSSLEKLHIGNNYISALRMASRTQCSVVHLIDFDRALHWIKRFPRELRDVVKMLPNYQGYVSFVRTNRSFQSHPQVQLSTETVANTIALEHKYFISTIEVEGLELETPDQYQKEITQSGYTAWLHEFESLPEWKKRVALLEKSTKVLIK